MRTTIDIPEDLINEAMKVTKASTKTEVIKTALYQIIQKNKIRGIKSYKGQVDLDMNLNILRDRDETPG